VPDTRDIVQKLWNLCNVLRDDGVTYLPYVTELTYLLFPKMTKETGTEDQIPKGYRWDQLAKKDAQRADPVRVLAFGSLDIGESPALILTHRVRDGARKQAPSAMACQDDHPPTPHGLGSLKDVHAATWFAPRGPS
jgi:hypothetical protein